MPLRLSKLSDSLVLWDIKGSDLSFEVESTHLTMLYLKWLLFHVDFMLLQIISSQTKVKWLN